MHGIAKAWQQDLLVVSIIAIIIKHRLCGKEDELVTELLVPFLHAGGFLCGMHADSLFINSLIHQSSTRDSFSTISMASSILNKDVSSDSLE